ncbi:AAA domain-containing protein [Mucilaginibacter gracilis]|uniref:AAA domain-containing protein n=1 Tax=Mucilaginibacter gracilis TaxID=423350 RepID=A0A495IW43_9SPHI|nr:AAA family ATPase [Mucilaginibacter gracilis]RKR80723.1 AAA domain-containing protein [Mucilaginibacter gracilis]
MKARTQKLTDGVFYQTQSTFRSIEKLSEEGEHLSDPGLLFGRYIPQASLIHFPSQRGVGKSWLCMQICMAVAGEWGSFLGEEINRHGNTLYVNHELSPNTMRRRSRKLYGALPQPLKNNYKALVFTTRAGLNMELANIIGYVEKYNPVLIVIDNLRMAFTETDLNNSRESTRVMNMLLAICDTSGAALIVTDHFRKHTNGQLTGSDLQSGSGIKTDLSDGDFFLRRSSQDKTLRILKRDKSRHFEESEDAKLIRLNPETLWFELVEDNVNEAEHIGLSGLKEKDEQKDMAQLLRSQGKNIVEIAKILGKGKSTIHRWLKTEEE